MSLPLVQPRDVAVLTEDEFNTLMRDLVWCELRRCDIAASQLSTNDTTKAKDQGVDLRIGAGTTQGDWLPDRPSAWQFKSGDCPSAKVLAGTTETRRKRGPPAKR